MATRKVGTGSRHIYTCAVCSKQFRSYNVAPKYCSLDCKAKAQSADVDPAVVEHLYHWCDMTQDEIAAQLHTTQKVIYSVMRRNGIATRKAAKRNQWGENNHMWKGDKASYKAFHLRLTKRFGQPKRCEVCGTTDPSKSYDWANVNGRYEDETDYVRMCRSCHHTFDKRALNFGATKGGDA